MITLLVPLAGLTGILDGWCGSVLDELRPNLGRFAVLDGILMYKLGAREDVTPDRLPELFLDFADAATRDRIERWGRLRTYLGGTSEQRVMYLGVREGIGYPGAFFDLIDSRGSVSVVGVLTGHIPALGDLDPGNDSRLPDGSRLVDALGLAIVCRHLAGGPT